MRRLVARWHSVVTRLLLVVVAALAAQFLLDLAARWTIIRSAAATWGANVEVANARLSLWERQLVLDGLRIKLPHAPTAESLKIDRCQLNFRVNPLLHKQAVIEHGRLAGMQFAPEPATAGPDRDVSKPAPAHGWLPGDADAPAHHWLAELDQRFQRLAECRFESLERAEALGTRCPNDCAVLARRGDELARRAIELQQATRDAEANHLRHSAFLDTLPRDVAALRQQSAQIGAELEKLSASLDAERRVIVAARQRDEQRLYDQLHIGPVDASSLTAYLLRQQLDRPLTNLLRWLHAMRAAVPCESAPSRRPARGEDILFAGRRPEPRCVIRTLEIQGDARFGRQPVQVTGLLTDLTDFPARHAAPIRLRLKSAAPPEIDVQATIDRTGALPRDQLLVDCRSIALPELHCGRQGELALRVEPAHGSLSISLSVEGDKLAGEIQLVHRQVRIRPQIDGELSELAVAAPLEAALDKLDSVATRISLDGTLAEPSCSLWSNLGPAVAEAMRRAGKKAAEQRARSIVADRRRTIDERLADAERRLNEQRLKLAARLSDVGNQLDSIARRQTPRERISAEQLGRRLPEHSLLR
jgi:hypothetical protein